MSTESSSARKTEEVGYQVYLEERKSLVDAKREGSRLFDKAIISLAAGAFGISLAFVRQIAPAVKHGTLLILAIAWAGFCISLLSTLISLLTSQSACSKQIKILEAEYVECLEQSNGRTSQARERKDLTNKPRMWTNRLNKLSILGFVIGAFFLAAFAITNLPRSEEVEMSDKEDEQELQEGFAPENAPKKHVEKGFVPESPPKKPSPKPSGEQK